MGQVIALFGQPEEEKGFPFQQSEKLSKIIQKFYLEGPELMTFYQTFRAMDKNGSGYITLENMFEMLEEEMTSSLSPCISRLFLLIEKETADKLSFVEWLPAMCVYCLYPRERIISFVFSMIDEDHDNCISKKDLIKFLVTNRYGIKIFPFNYVKAVELLEADRSDQIHLDDFMKLQSKIPFICYPAFRLQESLQQRILGQKFWANQYQKIKEAETKENAEKQYKKIQEEMQIKRQIKIEKKTAKFDQIYKNKKIKRVRLKDLYQRTVREPRMSKDDFGMHIFETPLIEISKEVQAREQRAKSLHYVKSTIIQEKGTDAKKNDDPNHDEDDAMFEGGLQKLMAHVKQKAKAKRALNTSAAQSNQVQQKGATGTNSRVKGILKSGMLSGAASVLIGLQQPSRQLSVGGKEPNSGSVINIAPSAKQSAEKH